MVAAFVYHHEPKRHKMSIKAKRHKARLVNAFRVHLRTVARRSRTSNTLTTAIDSWSIGTSLVMPGILILSVWTLEWMHVGILDVVSSRCTCMRSCLPHLYIFKLITLTFCLKMPSAPWHTLTNLHNLMYPQNARQEETWLPWIDTRPPHLLSPF